MNTISHRVPTFAPTPRREQPCPDGGGKGDFEFDLTTLDTAREMYFLPQMDRLAAMLAAQSDKPLQVRVEANNQFLEYTLTKDPLKPVDANLNGVPYHLEAKPSQTEAGAVTLNGTSAAGDFEGDLYFNADGSTQVVALAGPNRMPVNHLLVDLQQEIPTDPVRESRGNFACARMTHTYWPEGDHLHLMGNLGVHNIDAQFTGDAEHGYLLQGTFGDMEFKQTFTPVSERR